MDHLQTKDLEMKKEQKACYKGEVREAMQVKRAQMLMKCLRLKQQGHGINSSYVQGQHQKQAPCGNEPRNIMCNQ